MPPHPSETDQHPSLLASGSVARVQAAMTRLRYPLSVAAAAIIVAFTDRGPLWPGAVVALLGESLQVWASAHLRKNVELVMSGPYAWTRNPMYLGRFFVGLGFALLTWRWYLILPYLVFFPLYAQARVLGEEARLQRLFGERYSDYRAAVARWLPLPPRRRLSEGRWSWARVLRNHELRVAAAVVVALALLKWRAVAVGSLWSG